MPMCFDSPPSPVIVRITWAGFQKYSVPPFQASLGNFGRPCLIKLKEASVCSLMVELLLTLYKILCSISSIPERV